MTARSEADVFAERMKVVLAIGEATGARQRAQTAASGARIERMGVADRDGASDEAAATAEALDDAAQVRLAEIDARIAALEDRLAALDGELAAADR
jgi:uncharacterized protein YceH (UPF0502 family)